MLSLETHIHFNEIDNINRLYDNSKSCWKQQLDTNNKQCELVFKTNQYSLLFFQNKSLLVITQTRLGIGNNKKIYLAVDFHSGKEFAVILPLAISSNKIKEEAYIMSCLNGCEGILELITYYHDEQLEFIITPRYSMDLETFTNRYKLNIDNVKFISISLFKGLKNIQKKGFAHNDLKNKNILINIDCTNTITSVVMCDFGECMTQSRLDSTSVAFNITHIKQLQENDTRALTRLVYQLLLQAQAPNIPYYFSDRFPNDLSSFEISKAWTVMGDLKQLRQKTKSYFNNL